MVIQRAVSPVLKLAHIWPLQGVLQFQLQTLYNCAFLNSKLADFTNEIPLQFQPDFEQTKIENASNEEEIIRGRTKLFLTDEPF